jgi:hypothetical protein
MRGISWLAAKTGQLLKKDSAPRSKYGDVCYDMIWWIVDYYWIIIVEFLVVQKECSSHPPYSPGLDPSDFYLFGVPRNANRGKRFGSDEVTEDVKKCLRVQNSHRWKKYLDVLVYRWRKAVEVDEGYV